MTEVNENEEVNVQTEEVNVQTEENEEVDVKIEEEAVEGEKPSVVKKTRDDGSEWYTLSEKDNEISYPSFFVEDDDRRRIEIDIYFDKESGRIVEIDRKGDLEVARGIIYAKSTQWLEFSIPNFNDVSTYRQASAMWRGEQMVVDHMIFRDFLMKRHLKAWSLRDRNGESIELEIEDDVLSAKCAERIYKLSSGIIDTVMTFLQRDLLLII